MHHITIIYLIICIINCNTATSVAGTIPGYMYVISNRLG